MLKSLFCRALKWVRLDSVVGRVAVVMVLDDRGPGVPADTGNVNGSTVASAVRSAYNVAKGV